MRPPPLPDRAWKLLGLLWLLGIGLYVLLVLFPTRFTLLEWPLVGVVRLGDALHFLAFFILAAIFPLAFSSRVLVLFAPVALILLNVVLEFVQMHIPHRRFSEQDVLAGVIGCLVGTLLGWGVRLALYRRQGK